MLKTGGILSNFDFWIVSNLDSKCEKVLIELTCPNRSLTIYLLVGTVKSRKDSFIIAVRITSNNQSRKLLEIRIR
jgi:hypothetical protein